MSRQHLVILGVALGLSLPALAGTNGQQVSFRAFGDISRVKISGDNYKGLPVTWDSEKSRFNCNESQCNEVRTNSWWFKGKITIEYTLKDKRGTYACIFYVNHSQSGNWVNLAAPTTDVRVGGLRKHAEPVPECLRSNY